MNLTPEEESNLHPGNKPEYITADLRERVAEAGDSCTYYLLNTGKFRLCFPPMQIAG